MLPIRIAPSLLCEMMCTASRSRNPARMSPIWATPSRVGFQHYHLDLAVFVLAEAGRPAAADSWGGRIDEDQLAAQLVGIVRSISEWYPDSSSRWE